MFSLRMDKLVLISKDALPKRRICVRCKLLSSNSLQLIFLKALRRKCRHDSISISHLWKEFMESYKLCLNLWLPKWLRRMRSFVKNLVGCSQKNYWSWRYKFSCSITADEEINFFKKVMLYLKYRNLIYLSSITSQLLL